MTSQGLKRPSEFELPNSTQQHQPQQQQQANGILNTSSHSTNNGSSDKRRRLNEFNSIDNNNIINSSSPFKDSSLSTLSQDEITSLIQEEIHQTLSNQSNGNNINNLTANDPPVLTIRQTHAICERIIKDREQKLRDEYDRILACKLALTTTNLAFNLQQQAVAAAAIQQVQQQPRVSAVPNLSTHHHHLNQQQQQLNHHHHHQLINPAAAAAAAAAAANSLINRQNCTNNTNATNLINSSHMLTNNQTIPCGPVLLASNLDEQLAIPENLFTLFGVFGDVIRVKILFNKKDNALIQMADSNQAQVAQGHLDKQKIFGKVIRVARSKHLLVQMPRESNQTDAGLTKDFTNSPLHRFKIPGSRNYLNIYPPSNTLHISNIPANKSESDLQKAFKEACGFDLVSFKFFPKDRKMALMKFNSIEHATIALIKMHNYQIGDNINLKVSFSKSIMQQ